MVDENPSSSSSQLKFSDQLSELEEQENLKKVLELSENDWRLEIYKQLKNLTSELEKLKKECEINFSQTFGEEERERYLAQVINVVSERITWINNVVTERVREIDSLVANNRRENFVLNVVSDDRMASELINAINNSQPAHNRVLIRNLTSRIEEAEYRLTSRIEEVERRLAFRIERVERRLASRIKEVERGSVLISNILAMIAFFALIAFFLLILKLIIKAKKILTPKKKENYKEENTEKKENNENKDVEIGKSGMKKSILWSLWSILWSILRFFIILFYLFYLLIIILLIILEIYFIINSWGEPGPWQHTGLYTRWPMWNTGWYI